MDWFESSFWEQSALQAVCVISVIIAVGLGLGKLRVCGISLGVTFVFFTGILAGHLGLSIDPEILKYAEDFGLMLFVYELGLKVGPGFFSSFRTGGIKLNMLGLGLVLAGTAVAVALSYLMAIPMTDMVGILSGATTNTPSLGAAQQAISQLGLSTEGAALSCAVTYPLGVVGVILAFVVVRKFVARKSDYEERHQDDSDHTYVAEFRVTNPGIYGRSLREISTFGSVHFVVSRIWHDEDVSIPGPDDVLCEGDRVLVITNEDEVAKLTVLFGEKSERDWNKPDINWDSLDKNLVSRTITISKPQFNGRRLGSLKLRKLQGQRHTQTRLRNPRCDLPRTHPCLPALPPGRRRLRRQEPLLGVHRRNRRRSARSLRLLQSGFRIEGPSPRRQLDERLPYHRLLPLLAQPQQRQKLYP